MTWWTAQSLCLASALTNESVPPGLWRATVNDDAELLDRIRNGATDEFAEVVRRHQAQVFAILHRYERDHQKVEDLAQETFLKAWRFLDRFDGRAPFHHWLSKIALRVALDHLRRQKRIRVEVAMADLGEDALDWLQGPAADDNPGASAAAELLHAAMNELSPEDRQVLTLQEIEGLSVKEICRLTGFSSAAVRVRAFRARARLRKTLARLKELQHE
jgi:RNA polymerase sigma-70 factor (ECF subfamily)